MDECDELPSLCRGGSCINTPGSYFCQCPSGMVLSPDGNSCTGGYCVEGAAVSTPPGATSVSVRLAWSSHPTVIPVQVGTLCVCVCVCGGGGAAVSTPPAATSVSVHLAWFCHRTVIPVQVGTMCVEGAAVSTPPAATSVGVHLAWSSPQMVTLVQVGTVCVGGGGGSCINTPGSYFCQVSIWHGPLTRRKFLYRWVLCV